MNVLDECYRAASKLLEDANSKLIMCSKECFFHAHHRIAACLRVAIRVLTSKHVQC